MGDLEGLIEIKVDACLHFESRSINPHYGASLTAA